MQFWRKPLEGQEPDKQEPERSKPEGQKPDKQEKGSQKPEGQKPDKQQPEKKRLGKNQAEKKRPEKKKAGTGSWKADRRLLIKAAACAAVVFALGILFELFCNLPLIQNKREGNFEIPLSQTEYEGFELRTAENGSQALVLTEEVGRIHIPVGEFIGKLACSYEYEGLLNLTAEAHVENEYGEVRERDSIKIQDRNPKTNKTTWLNIRRETESVDLTVSREGLFEPGLSYIDFSSMPLAVTGFSAVTKPAVNPYRLCFFWAACGTALLLIMARRQIGRHIEMGFLIVALVGGTLFSLSLPADKVGFDEEIHFEQSFWIANYRSPVHLSPTIFQEFSAGIDTWPLNQPGGLEEQRELNHYLNETGDYRNGSMLWSADLNKTTFTGYLGQAAVLKACQILNLPFSLLFKLGRLGNLFVYCLVMALAIRKTPVGKGIMAFIGLMPAPLMLAGVYSYDPAVTAFLYLSCACILKAVLEPEGRLSVKEYVLILAAFFWGCRIKAVYAPLILTGLLIPASRYGSRKQMRWMRAGFVALFVILMASFVLPVLISPSETGDLRGGATSEAGQMAYVLGQPFAYARILFENIFLNFPSYVLGEGAFGVLGHLGTISFPWLLYAGSTAVILTDTRSSCGKRLTGWQRLWIFVLAGACAVLVWTSMYIAFTPPGNTYIEGVQGRYYLPFLFLLWLVPSPSAVTVHLKNEVYYPALLGLAGVILYAVYAADVLIPHCL